MPVVAWIVLGIAAWTLCGVLAIAVSVAARRGDSLTPQARMGVDPNVEVVSRRRMVVEVTPAPRPWATSGAGAPAVASALVEAGGPRG
jgi:hypothetical protein